MQIKIQASSITCEFTSRCVNFRKGVQKIGKKMVPYVSMQVFDSSFSLKESFDRKENKKARVFL